MSETNQAGGQDHKVVKIVDEQQQELKMRSYIHMQPAQWEKGNGQC